jgi:hypothetical protein
VLARDVHERFRYRRCALYGSGMSKTRCAERKTVNVAMRECSPQCPWRLRDGATSHVENSVDVATELAPGYTGMVAPPGGIRSLTGDRRLTAGVSCRSRRMEVAEEAAWRSQWSGFSPRHCSR